MRWTARNQSLHTFKRHIGVEMFQDCSKNRIRFGHATGTLVNATWTASGKDGAALVFSDFEDACGGSESTWATWLTLP